MSEFRGPVLVVGAGTMGHGIAQVCAVSGFETRLCDADPQTVEKALARIRERLARDVEKGRLDEQARDRALSLLSAADTLEEGAAGAGLVIEAVYEDMELKKQILGRAARHTPEHAVLASNTSSLSLTEIAAGAGRPERTIGLHFFNPVPRMRLLEIVRAEQTAPDVVEGARAFAERLGKEPIVVTDSPGFATSRLGLALGLEAMRMLESGVASAEDIDRAMKLGYGHPMGPLELTDLVGLDVRLAIAEHLHREVGEAFRPPAILRRLVRAGRLGKKTGRGFYDWTER